MLYFYFNFIQFLWSYLYILKCIVMYIRKKLYKNEEVQVESVVVEGFFVSYLENFEVYFKDCIKLGMLV